MAQKYPTTPGQGHFLLQDACWLDEDKAIPLDDIEGILIDSAEVKLVEFMKMTEEK